MRSLGSPWLGSLCRPSIIHRRYTVLPPQIQPICPETPQVLDPLDHFHEYPPGVTVIRDRHSAQRVVAELLELTDHIHACDTETAMIDDRKGIIGRPIPVICASIYAGPHFDFGSGPMVWIGVNPLVSPRSLSPH